MHLTGIDSETVSRMDRVAMIEMKVFSIASHHIDKLDAVVGMHAQGRLVVVKGTQSAFTEVVDPNGDGGRRTFLKRRKLFSHTSA